MEYEFEVEGTVVTLTAKTRVSIQPRKKIRISVDLGADPEEETAMGNLEAHMQEIILKKSFK